MSILSDYADRYPSVRFMRRDGILEVTLHTDGGPLRWGIEALRWLGLVAAMSFALAVLYRVAPDRDDPEFKEVT